MNKSWEFFLDKENEIAFCKLCSKCARQCKQSHRAVVVGCPRYLNERKEPEVNSRECVVCGNSFKPHGRKIYCSTECERVGNKKKSKERMKKMRGQVEDDVAKSPEN